VNLLHQLERIINNALRPGYFKRDIEGNEYSISGYIVGFTYEHRGETKEETSVVLAVSEQDAITAATKPYKNISIISITNANPGNNRTLLRAPMLLEGQE